jgi:hypothetical protein
VAAALWLVVLGAPPATEASESELRLETETGYDSNPFLAPSESYFDQNSHSIVAPVRTPGFFTAARVDARWRARRSFLAVRCKSKLYPDERTKNANELQLKVTPGYMVDADQGEHRRTFAFGPFVSYNKEIYFDRDTGSAGEISGIDAANRYSYVGLGGELRLEYESSRRFAFDLSGTVERRDYENVPGLESFDQNRFKLAAGIAVRLARPVYWYVDYVYRFRDEEERLARDLTGNKEETHPNQQYSYRTVKTELRVRPTRSWSFRTAYGREVRRDEYVRYSDSVKDDVRVRATFARNRWRLWIGARLSERKFDNAYIFDDPVAANGQPNPHKHYQTLELLLAGELRWRHFRLHARVEDKDQRSADPRYTFQRTRAVVGTKLIY